MSSESLHEAPDLLSEKTKNLHRAVVSLIEELEAVDWYTQRAEACSDADLRAVLLHHRDEEIEHAMMNLEWIRRHEPAFDQRMRTYLFQAGDILQIEAVAEKGAAPSGAEAEAPRRPAAAAGGSLGVGGLRAPRTEAV